MSPDDRLKPGARAATGFSLSPGLERMPTIAVGAAASLARGYDATVYVRLLGALRAAVFGRLRAGDEPRPADVDGLREVVRAHLTNAARVAFQAA